ncbi:MAG: DinB family protein [Ferrovibrionaceae bacterium]
MTASLTAMFGYQAWANAELFACLERLDAAVDQPAVREMLRLVDHNFVVADIFAAHLAGTGHAYATDGRAEPPPLPDLRAAVAASDRWFLDYVDRVSPADLSQAVAFTFTDGDAGRMTRAEMLTHVVLHGGYHRGEVGRILRQLAITPPWDTFAVHLHRAEPARRLRVAG